MLKLKQINIDESISIKDMKVGQIGVITEWNEVSSFNGVIVKRTPLGLTSLNTDDVWGNNFLESNYLDKLRVKIIPNGTELAICNNE